MLIFEMLGNFSALFLSRETNLELEMAIMLITKLLNDQNQGNGMGFWDVMTGRGKNCQFQTSAPGSVYESYLSHIY